MNKNLKLTALEKNWILYDVGNSAFILLVATLVPIYFNSLASAAGVHEDLYLSYWGYAGSLATVLVALLGPICGALADRKMKKAFFLLALLLVFALAATAFATETGATTTTGTITVANPVAGRTYTAYKVFDVTYDGNGHYSYTLDPFANDLLHLNVIAYANEAEWGLEMHKVGPSDAQTEMLYFTTNDKFSPAHFAAYLKGNLDRNPASYEGKELTEQGDGTVSVPNLPLGYYFVYSDTGALCNLTTTNPTATIHDKNDMPFEKVVDKPSVDVGQVVTYTITGKVPDSTGFNTYIYEIEDTLSNGLSYIPGTLKVKVGGNNLADGASDTYTTETLKINGRKDAYNYIKVGVDVKKFTVGDPIEVTYQAIVNKNAIAVVSNNEAKLTYSNNPSDSESTTTTPAEIAKVYTSEIVIDKHETDKETTKLPNAQFVLYKEVTTDAGSSTVYYKWRNAELVEWVENRADATVVETDNQGAAYFGGLADGTYYLKEIKAPAGYNQLEKPVTVTVAGSSTDITKLTVTANVANSTGTLLPSTGGMGTTVFYVLGAVLVLGAVVLLVTKKRMSDANR